MKETEKTASDIFFFVPNMIGYIRLACIALAWYFIDDYRVFLPPYLLSVGLDAVDGWAARKLDQVSDYGACLDVVVDLIGRGMVWCYVSKYGYAVMAFEWLVYLGNTERSNGRQWKESFGNVPVFVHWVMDKGFKTPLGAVAITGLHVLPTWLYIMKMNTFSGNIIRILEPLKIMLIGARLVCASVEMWCLWKYLELLLHRNPHKDSYKTM